MTPTTSSPPPNERRVIKRYSNRKLYDTQDSRYVTLLQIADIVRAGEDVLIIDNATKEDKTDITLALIISEELKAKPRDIPLTTLKALIRQRRERMLSHLRGGPIGKLMPKSGEDEVQAVVEEVEQVTQREGTKGIRATLEHWQHAIDERIRAVLPNFSVIRELQDEVRQLSSRIDALEQRSAKNIPPEGTEE